jgi:hypothetical protein
MKSYKGILFIPCIIHTIKHVHQQTHTIGLQTAHKCQVTPTFHVVFAVHLCITDYHSPTNAQR